MSSPKRVGSRVVTDDFWQRVEPLIPARQRVPGKTYSRLPGAGRTPKPARLVFEAISYVLRTGCELKTLLGERFGSAGSAHKRFPEWQAADVFCELWKAGLADCDPMQGVAWRWQSIDGTIFRAPMAQELVWPNPTDQGKKWEQAPPVGRRSWRPVVPRRDRSERA